MAGNYTLFPNPSGSNASVGTNGATAPTHSTEIAGVNAGNLVPVSVDSSGNQNVNIVNFSPSSPIPTDLEKVGGTAVSLGQKVMASSLPMVIASDQSAIPASQSGTWNINNITGTVSLPTGASTSANQTNGSQITQIASLNNTISTNNSSTTPLAGNATYTGTAEIVTNFTCIQVYLGVDQSGTLNIDYSNDGTHFDQTESYTVTVGSPGSVSGFAYQFMTEGEYYRLRYVNGSSAQGVFRLQSILKMVPGISEVQPISQGLLGSTDAQTTKGVIYGASTAGGTTYVAVKVTPSGAVNSAIGDISGVVGQQTMANSLPVAIASNQSAIPASQSGTWTVTANAGTNLNTSSLALDTSVNGILVSQGSTTSGEKGPLIQGAVTTSAPSYTTAQTSPLSLTTAGNLRVDGSSVTQPTSETTSSTSTVTSVASSATNVTLLASNASRKNAAFYNDSTQILYLKLGTTASNTSYTIQLLPNGYYELPVGKIYTGQIDGIWASANGNARITELT